MTAEMTRFMQLQMEKLTSKLNPSRPPTRNEQTQTSLQGVPYMVVNISDETAMGVAHIPGASNELTYIN